MGGRTAVLQGQLQQLRLQLLPMLRSFGRSVGKDESAYLGSSLGAQGGLFAKLFFDVIAKDGQGQRRLVCGRLHHLIFAIRITITRYARAWVEIGRRLEANLAKHLRARCRQNNSTTTTSATIQRLTLMGSHPLTSISIA